MLDVATALHQVIPARSPLGELAPGQQVPVWPRRSRAGEFRLVLRGLLQVFSTDSREIARVQFAKHLSVALRNGFKRS